MKKHVWVTFGTRSVSSSYKTELALSFHPEGSLLARDWKKVGKLKPYKRWLSAQPVSGKYSPATRGVSGYPHAGELSNQCSAQKGW